MADAIARRVEGAVSDPDHPWARHWPTAPEMAAEFGTTRKTVYIALNHLGDAGVLVKAWMHRPRGRAEVWVPPVRAAELRPPPSRDEIASHIERRHSTGDRAVLPALDTLAEHFGVSKPTVRKAIRLLAEQNRAVMLRVDGKYRWCLIPPDQRHSVNGASHRTVHIDLTQLGDEEVWVPHSQVPELRPPPSTNEIASEIERRSSTGNWVVPALDTLAEHFGVSKPTARKAIRLLADRGRAVKLRVDREYRWCLIPPDQPDNANQRLTMTSPSVVISDLIRRILAGEFRYRIPPDPTVHDRPFLGNREIETQYKVSTVTSGTVRRELVRLGWIVPGERSNTNYRLTQRVPPINRSTPPAPRPARKKPKPPPRNRRARPIAYDLIRRIRAGEFRYRPFPSMEKTMAEYRASAHNVRAAFEVLEQHGWVTFEPCDLGRMAVLLPQFQRVPRNYVQKRSAGTGARDRAQRATAAVELTEPAGRSGPVSLGLPTINRPEATS